MLLNPLLFYTFPQSSYFSSLSLHDALPIWSLLSSPMGIGINISQGIQSAYRAGFRDNGRKRLEPTGKTQEYQTHQLTAPHLDRKSTRLNSSHLVISYAVFCLKKKIIVTISL